MINSDNNNLIASVKNMSTSEMEGLAAMLRQDIIRFVAKNGGHLASNLGVVELTLALHKVFNTPKDKIIFDVGHQCYVHKMLTGRYSEMDNLRCFEGISGFPKIEESKHDMFDSGHSGTSIGAILGYATARDLAGENYACISVIGDGSLTAGVAWEALNMAGASKTPMIVILNDNEMSISGNVGGITKHLTKLRTSKSYIRFKNSIKSTGFTGLQKSLEKIRNSIKYNFLPGVIFEELGFKYYGPIDGHNIDQLVASLEFVKELNRPVLLHVVTKKGLGFKPAELNPAKFHGIGSFDINKVDASATINDKAWSEVFGKELCDIAKENEKVTAISAAMIDGTGLTRFKSFYPNRIFDVGIAEQNAVAFASGLALNGYRPVVALYSTFLQRAFDQVLSEVALQKLPIVFAIDRAGITGQDGETHQGQFDISFLNLVPNMTILSPRDASTLKKMLRYAFTLNSPVAIRYPRGNAPENELESSEKEFNPIFEVVRPGKDVVLFTDGGMFETSMKVANLLAPAYIDVCVVDLRILKPLNEEKILQLVGKYSHVVTIEDGTVVGGIGSSINSLLAKSKTAKVLNLGWPDKYIPQGKVCELRIANGLDEVSITKKIKEFYEEKA